jgi:hypothetical protein
MNLSNITLRHKKVKAQRFFCCYAFHIHSRVLKKNVCGVSRQYQQYFWSGSATAIGEGLKVCTMDDN